MISVKINYLEISLICVWFYWFYHANKPFHRLSGVRDVRYSIVLLMALAISGVITACGGPKGETAVEKRSAIKQMRRETLADLYRYAPEARRDIGTAYGYAVFSNIGLNIFVLATGRGYGIAKNNRTGNETYMKMFSAGVGVGMGVKDFRGVFVFDNENVYNRFVNSGWQASGEADAAGKMGGKGAAVGLAVELEPGLRLYQLTESGLALQATVQGTKYWKDDELN